MVPVLFPLKFWYPSKTVTTLVFHYPPLFISIFSFYLSMEFQILQRHRNKGSAIKAFSHCY